MKRRLFTILSAISLLLCVATVALWVRSHYIADTVRTERAIFTDDWYVYRRSAVIRYGGLRLLQLDGLDMSARDSETMRRYQQMQGLTQWHVEHERTEDYEVSPSVPFGEHRYPFPFLGHNYSFWNKLGFAWQDSRMQMRSPPPGFVYAGLTVPLWFMSLMFAFFPALWVRGWVLRRNRIRRHGCPACGYDLRATPDRCPECGTETVTKR